MAHLKHTQEQVEAYSKNPMVMQMNGDWIHDWLEHESDIDELAKEIERLRKELDNRDTMIDDREDEIAALRARVKTMGGEL